MSRRIVRGVLLVALLLSLAIRFQSSRAREVLVTEFDAGAAIAQVLRSHGLQLRKNPVEPPKVLSVVVYFQRPECDRVSLVFPYFISAETEPLLARVTEPGSARHYYYLDSSWNDQHRVSMFLEWARYAVLDLFGASPYLPVKTAIVLADPPDCRPADVIDWRALWKKHPAHNLAHSDGAASG